MKTIKSLVIPILLFVIFTLFLTEKIISQYTYVGLFTLTTIIGFVIYFKDIITSIDLKQMKLILRDAKVVEKAIKKTAEDLIEIVTIHSTYTSGSTAQRKKFNNRVQTFLEEIGTEKNKKEKILDNARFVEKFMNPNNTPEEQEEFSKEMEKRKILE